MDLNENCKALVSSSLASVIRHSLNPQFRQECRLILGDKNVRYSFMKIAMARDIIYSSLTKRECKDNVEAEKDSLLFTSTASSTGTEVSCDCHHPGSVNSRPTQSPQDKPDINALRVDMLLREDTSSVTASPNLLKEISDSDAQSDDESQLEWEIRPIFFQIL